jgi:hypothetical protein
MKRRKNRIQESLMDGFGGDTYRRKEEIEA